MTNPKHTDTSRSGDLVMRLRNLICHGNLSCDTLGDCDEAADRIEALEAENERLRGALQEIIAYSQKHIDDTDAYTMSRHKIRVARAALGEKQ